MGNVNFFKKLKNNFKLVNFFSCNWKMTFLLILIINLLDILSLGMIFPVIAIVFNTSAYESLIRYFHVSVQYNTGVKIIIFAFIIFSIIKSLISYLLQKSLMADIFNIYKKMSLFFVRSDLNKNFTFFLDTDTSNILKKIDYNIEYVTYYSILPFFNLISDIFFALIISISFLVFNFKLTLLLFVFFFIFIFFYNLISKNYSKEIGEEIKESTKKNLKLLQEIITNIKIILLGQKENYFLEKFEIEKKRQANALKNNQIFSILPKLSIELFFITGLFFTIYFFFVNSQNDKTSIIPSLTLISAISIRLIPLINRLIYSLQSINSSYPFLSELVMEMNNHYNRFENKNLPIIKTNISCIKLNDVSFNYRNSLEPQESVLSEVSLNIYTDTMVAFVGDSGSGKSTFLNLIVGLLKPTIGNIEWMAENKFVSPIGNVSLLDQNVTLIDGSISENVCFGEPHYDIEKVINCLKMADLSELIIKVTKDSSWKIGENGNKLSGGQRQRLSLARIFYEDRSVLILDEPTSALHDFSEEQVFKYLKMLKNKIIIVVTHSIKNLKYFDSIYQVESKLIKKIK